MKQELRIFLVALWLIFPLLTGQAQADPDPVQLQFRTIGWRLPETALFYRDSLREDVPVEVRPRAISDFYPYTGDGSLVFYRIERNAEGEPQRIPVAGVRLPEDTPSVLLLFTPPGAEQESASSPQIEVIPDAPDRFGAGAVMAVNLTGSAVAVRIDEEIQEIPDGAVRILPTVSGQGIEMLAAMKGAEGYELLYSTRLRLYPGDRQIAFLFRDGGNFRIERVTEIADRVAERLKDAERNEIKEGEF